MTLFKEKLYRVVSPILWVGACHVFSPPRRGEYSEKPVEISAVKWEFQQLTGIPSYLDNDG
jgi:hypothetical protein